MFEQHSNHWKIVGHDGQQQRGLVGRVARIRIRPGIEQQSQRIRVLGFHGIVDRGKAVGIRRIGIGTVAQQGSKHWRVVQHQHHPAGAIGFRCQFRPVREQHIDGVRIFAFQRQHKQGLPGFPVLEFQPFGILGNPRPKFFDFVFLQQGESIFRLRGQPRQHHRHCGDKGKQSHTPQHPPRDVRPPALRIGFGIHEPLRGEKSDQQHNPGHSQRTRHRGPEQELLLSLPANPDMPPCIPRSEQSAGKTNADKPQHPLEPHPNNVQI